MKIKLITVMLILFSGWQLKAQITAPEPLAGKALTKEYIMQNMVYPEADLQKGNNGKVIISLHVDANGAGSQYAIKSSFSEAASQNALHLVKTILWKPALDVGIPVNYDTEYEVDYNTKNYKRYWKRHERLVAPLTLEVDTSYKIYEYKQLEEVAKPYFADGGNMGNYIAKNLQFPAEAKEREIQGTVRLSFEWKPTAACRTSSLSTRWVAAATTRPSGSFKRRSGFLPKRTGNMCAAQGCRTSLSASAVTISKTGIVIS